MLDFLNSKCDTGVYLLGESEDFLVKSPDKPATTDLDTGYNHLKW